MSLSLTQYVDRYALDHDIQQSTADSYRTAAKRYEGYVRKHATELQKLEGLNELSTVNCVGVLPMRLVLNREVMNRFLLHLTELERSKHTIASYKTTLLVLWRDACEVDLSIEPPRRIRQVRLPETPKDIWTPAEVSRLLDACKTRRGLFRVTRIRRWKYFDSIIRAAWDSSLRLGDLLTLRVDDFGEVFDRLQNKTGRLVDCAFRPETITAIQATFEPRTPKRDLIWPLWARREEFYAQFRKIAKAAELKGTFKKLRRSSITNVEKHGGPGWVQAGHSSPTTTIRWYLNKSEAYADRPRPEALPEACNP